MTTQLYLISPPRIELTAFLPKLEDAFSGGKIASFQLRLKETGDGDIVAAAKAIKPLCHAHECAFILNDRANLARELRADGLHLGQDDMPVKEARAIVGEEMIIGVSAHASRHLAMEAGEQGADYVAFGAFYPTTSKPQAKIDKWGVPEPEILGWWSDHTVLPCVAIGGITPANCAPLAAAGADFVAAITAVWNDPQGPAHAVSQFVKALGAAGDKA